MQQPHLTSHEWEMVLALVERAMENSTEKAHSDELARILIKVEEALVI